MMAREIEPGWYWTRWVGGGMTPGVWVPRHTADFNEDDIESGLEVGPRIPEPQE